jgi:hypothetical protein
MKPSRFSRTCGACAAVVMMASPAPALSASPPAPIAVLAYGADSCGQYIDASQSEDDLYLSWALGFISGANIADTGAGRMAGEHWDEPSMAMWLGNFCSQHPLVPFVRAVESLRVALGGTPL